VYVKQTPVLSIKYFSTNPVEGWVQSLDWTTELDSTGLTQTAKYNSFSAEHKLNFLFPQLLR